MEIIGLLTIALVAGTLARILYRHAVPTDVLPSLLLGAAGVAAGVAIDSLTGVGEMTSAASLTSWITALTGACVMAVIADAVHTVARPLRTLGRAS